MGRGGYNGGANANRHRGAIIPYFSPCPLRPIPLLLYTTAEVFFVCWNIANCWIKELYFFLVFILEVYPYNSY